MRIGRRIDLDVIVDRGQLAQERLGDLAVGRDDDFAGLRVDHVERNLLAEEDVGQRLGEFLAQLVHLLLVTLPRSAFDLALASRSASASRARLSLREETLTSMTMP